MFNENGKSWFTGTQAAVGYETRYREQKGTSLCVIERGS